MRAMIVLALATSPFALAATADAQSVIQDGRWVSGTPKPAPTPAPAPVLPPEAPAAAIVDAPASLPDAPIMPPQAAPGPRFAPSTEIVQPLPAARARPARSAAVPAAPSPRADQPLDLPAAPPPAPVATAAPAEAAPGATYAPPASPVRRADASPPPPAKPHQGRKYRRDQAARHHDVRTAGHGERRHDWGRTIDGRWEGGWQAPGGWQAYRQPSRGWALPRYWSEQRFTVEDYWTYDLDEPGHGFRWVRYYDDAVLVDRDWRVVDWRDDIDWDWNGRDYRNDDAYADSRHGDGYPHQGYDGSHPVPHHVGPGVTHLSGGYIANGYYYPPAVTTTVTIHSEPVTRTYVTEEVVHTGVSSKGVSRARPASSKKCRC